MAAEISPAVRSGDGGWGWEEAGALLLTALFVHLVVVQVVETGKTVQPNNPWIEVGREQAKLGFHLSRVI